MAKPLAAAASAVQASTTLAIDSMYKKMRADGIDVIGFGAGEPDFNTPESIKNAAISAINNNKTHYTPAAGTESLRKVICARLKADYDIDYAPSQIVVSSGAKHNLYIAMKALVDPGDEVILPSPYWVSYEEQIKMAGGKPVIVHTTAATRFEMTAELLKGAITPKTKAIVINSPSNPTGMVYTREQLFEIGKMCAEQGIYIISDEIYSHLVYDGAQFNSMASLGEDIKDITILINGVSKTYAMTGWRIGFSASNQNLATVMANFQSHSTSAPCSIAQAAAEEALAGPQDSISEMRAAFEHRRNTFIKRLETIPGVSCLKPDGAFYVMLDVSSTFGKTCGGTVIKCADDFAKLLLEKALVAVVPCDGFGAPEYVRMSYAVHEDTILKGLDRLDEFMKSL